MDLVYGHLGQPVYDAESKTWHFGRDTHSKRYVRPLCPLLTAKESEARASFEGDKRQIERSLPGVDHAMLQGLLRSSEAIELATSQHDPTVSDLIAYGNAVDKTLPPDVRDFRCWAPIVAIAGGAAGESVRLILLTRESLKWKDYKGVRLHITTARNGLEGWWRGNGGKIQQVAFAGKELTASTFLAVRSQGAISILSPELQMQSVYPTNAHGQIQDLPPSRLNANHVVTLNPDADGVPFADVAFDPWDCLRFVIIDQAGRWQIWRMKKGAPYFQTLSAVKDMNGSISENHNSEDLKPILDGWARALWVVDSNTLIVATRTAFAIFEANAKRVGQKESDLQLAKYSDWILDIRKGRGSQRHLLVLTSSRLLLLSIRGAEYHIAKPDTAVILVSWIHFRAHQDVSLSLSMMESAAQRKDLPVENGKSSSTYRGVDTDLFLDVMVTLYSRLNGLATVFAFRHSNVTNQASSLFDPCLLPLPNTSPLPRDPRKARQDEHFLSPLLCLKTSTIPLSQDYRVEHPEVFEQTAYHMLLVLNHDWSFSEHLYVASTVPNLPLKAPDSRKRGWANTKKGKPSAVVTDDFIVPDNVVDDSAFDFGPDLKPAYPVYGLAESHQRNTDPLISDAPTNPPVDRSLNMQWLAEQTRDKYDDSDRQPFSDFLEVVQEGIAEKLYTVKPGVETLLEMGMKDPLITDVDEAAASFRGFLASIAHNPSDTKKDKAVSKEQDSILLSLLPQISDKWNGEQDTEFVQIYEGLVRSEITPLPSDIPGRVRLGREKRLRSVASQIFLAAHTVSTRVKTLPADELNEEHTSSQISNIHLPVREKDSGPSLSTRATSPARSALISSQASVPPSQQVDPQTLSEETNTESVDRQFVEDPSSAYLRNLGTLTPQACLPPRLSNILNHWNVGENPADYDWEVSQRVTVNLNDEAGTDEQVRSDRAAKKGKKRARNISSAESPLGKSILQTQMESSSQPAPKRILEMRSQEAPRVIASSQMMPGSSQAGESVASSSQPLLGKFASGKKVKKPKKKGF